MKCLHGFSLSRLFVASLPLLVACGSGSSATLFSGSFQAAPGSTAGSSSASASGGSGGSRAVTAQPASGGATQLGAGEPIGGASADTAVGGSTGNGATTSKNPSAGASSTALGGAPGAAGNASGTAAGASGASGPSNGVGGGANGVSGSSNGAFGGANGVSGSSNGVGGGANGGSAASSGAAGGSNNQSSPCPVEAPEDQSACTAATPDSCYWKGVACSCFADDPGNGNPGRGAPSRSWSCVGTPDRCPDAVPMDGAPCRNLGGASCPYSAQDYCVCVQGQGRNSGGDLSWSCSSAVNDDCPLLAPIPGSQPRRTPSCDMAIECSYGDRACFCDTSDWHCE
jgi:hypothetical protein